MIGRPVTERTDSAAPPRASPSSLVRTTPSKPTPSRNACAVVTASWPIIASTTKRISSGLTASRMSAACCIISASTPSRPAVSTMTTSYSLRRAPSVAAPATPARAAAALAAPRREARSPAPLAVDLQLGDGVRALEVGGDQHRLPAFLFQPVRELRGERRLAGALETRQHDHGRRVLGEAQPPGLTTEDL